MSTEAAKCNPVAPGRTRAERENTATTRSAVIVVSVEDHRRSRHRRRRRRLLLRCRRNRSWPIKSRRRGLVRPMAMDLAAVPTRWSLRATRLLAPSEHSWKTTGQAAGRSLKLACEDVWRTWIKPLQHHRPHDVNV